MGGWEGEGRERGGCSDLNQISRSLRDCSSVGNQDLFKSHSGVLHLGRQRAVFVFSEPKVNILGCVLFNQLAHLMGTTLSEISLFVTLQ